MQKRSMRAQCTVPGKFRKPIGRSIQPPAFVLRQIVFVLAASVSQNTQKYQLALRFVIFADFGANLSFFAFFSFSMNFCDFFQKISFLTILGPKWAQTG